MTDFKISNKKKVKVLIWLEENTLPKSYKLETLEMKAEEFFANNNPGFPYEFEEFDHLVEHLAELGLVQYDRNNSRRRYKILADGQSFLQSYRENLFWRKWPRQIVDNIPTILVSVVSALCIGWILNFWGPQ